MTKTDVAEPTAIEADPSAKAGAVQAIIDAHEKQDRKLRRFARNIIQKFEDLGMPVTLR